MGGYFGDFNANNRRISFSLLFDIVKNVDTLKRNPNRNDWEFGHTRKSLNKKKSSLVPHISC